MTRGKTDERSCLHSQGDQEVRGQVTLVHADEDTSSKGATSDAFNNQAVLGGSAIATFYSASDECESDEETPTRRNLRWKAAKMPLEVSKKSRDKQKTNKRNSSMIEQEKKRKSVTRFTVTTLRVSKSSLEMIK